MEKFKDIREKIMNNYDSFSNNEKKVAKYVVDNLSEIVLLSSTELASKAQVSDSTVVRFAKSLGYKGYLEFKKNLKEKNSVKRNPYDYLKKMESKYNSKYIDSYLSTLQGDLHNFINNLDYSTVNDIVHKLLKASTVYLVGIGSDAVIATFLNNYLGLMGINTRCIREGGLPLKEALYQLGPDDIIFMSGFPQILKDEKWVADFCKLRGAQLITVTDSLITSSYLNSDINVVAKESVDNFFNSSVLPLVFCNILLLRLYETSPDRIESALKKYGEILSDEELYI
ncbi:MAG: MurR/RpiR family transcriptional regulator [Clostridiales bacterium]|jgi:DNA-binding MurR/RpiR family transcriptional regulator|nr:MurR/RpiR family transcriptional regulator [Clostridiales bacterium]